MISLSVRNRVCELTIIDSFLKQYICILSMGLRCFLMLHDTLHISDTCLCILRSERARLHSAGRGRLNIVRDGMGTVLNLIATRGNGFISTGRDGTGYDFYSCVSLSSAERWMSKAATMLLPVKSRQTAFVFVTFVLSSS